MKKFKSFLLLAFILFIYVTAVFGKNDKSKELTIHKMELGYPCPAIPFYHFIAELELPHASIIEVEAIVNGKVLRFTDLHRSDAITDMNRPVISHRPPSGYGLSQDGTLYQHPHLVGWVKWEPGREYEIQLNVRMKKNIHASKDDVFLSASRKLIAPEGIAVYDKDWKNNKSNHTNRGTIQRHFPSYRNTRQH